MFSVTIITANKPAHLSKKFSLEGGVVLRKTPGGQLVDGIAERREFPTMNAFVDALAGLVANQALTFGVTSHDRARIVAQDAVARTTDPTLPVIARTRDHFAYPAGRAVFMIDFDPRKDAETIYTNDELLALLYGICPAMQGAPHAVTSTASSFIYNGDDQVIGQKGRRIYVAVANGRDITRAGAVLFKRLQLAGLGHIEISKSGQLLERSIIDACVYQPERLDFAGGADCVAPLTQRRPQALLFNPDAGEMDTRTALPDLTAGEEAKRREIVGVLKAAAKPQSVEARGKWAEEQVGRLLAKTGDTPVSNPKRAGKLLEVYRNAAEHHDLFGEFELAMADGRLVTVGEILAEPDRYHGKRCADPLEPTYGNDNRIAYLNLRAAGTPYIYSHAHHGVRYYLRRERRAHVVQAGERLAAIDALLGAMRSDGGLYERNGEIVRVTADASIVPLNMGGVLLEADRLVRWQKKAKATDDFVPCDCPRPIAEGVMAMRGRWGLPKLDAVTTAPLYHPGAGRVIERDGFDAETGLLMVCDDLDRWPGVPTDPTLEHVKEALATIWKPFELFPFCGALDRGVLLAAILTAMGRPAYATAPGFLVTASTAGSGKSLLARCLAYLAGCWLPAVMTGAEDDSEMRKRLVAVGRRGAAAVVLDNLTGYLDSDALCAWTTSEYLSDRILGMSEEVMVKTGGLLLATGNNVAVKGDLCRRIFTCRIEAEMETPWKRSFDVDPAAYCQENRLAMVAAGLTVMRYYMARPNPLKDRTASFEAWSDTIRRAVVGVANDGLMDVADPVGSIDAAFDEDPETGKLRALLASWVEVFADKPVLVGEAIKAAADSDDLDAAMQEIAGERGFVNDRRLGRWIERNARRRVDGAWFESAGKRRGSKQWRARKEGLVGLGGISSLLRIRDSEKIYMEQKKPAETLKPSPPPCPPQAFPERVVL